MSELQGLQSRIDEIRSLGGEVLAISADPAATTAERIGDLFDFPLLADPDLEVIDRYGLRHEGASIEGGDIARPAVFLVAPDGGIAWRDLTDNWRVRVRPERVLEQLRSLDTG